MNKRKTLQLTLLLTVLMITFSTNAIGGTVTSSYEYDDNDRLIKVVRSNDRTTEYQYDQTGNRTLMNAVTAQTDYYAPQYFWIPFGGSTVRWQEFKNNWTTISEISFSLDSSSVQNDILLTIIDSNGVQVANQTLPAKNIVGFNNSVIFSQPVAVVPGKVYKIILSSGSSYKWLAVTNRSMTASGLKNDQNSGIRVIGENYESRYIFDVFGTTQSSTNTLNINSNQLYGYPFSVSPPDIFGQGIGLTSLSRLYTTDATVTVTAPLSVYLDPYNKDAVDSHMAFTSWSGCDVVDRNVCTVVMSRPRWINANYINTQKPIDGECGLMNGKSLSYLYNWSSGLCKQVWGTQNLTGTGPWSWTCTGNYGGKTAECSAQLDNTPPVVTLTSVPMNFSKEASGTIAFSSNEPRLTA